jgi:tellurium resistance protein TerD
MTKFLIIVGCVLVLVIWNKSLSNKERPKNLKDNKSTHCPKCMSPNVMPVKKGFRIGKAIVGGLILGPLALVGGVNKTEMICNKCGHKYKN